MSFLKVYFKRFFLNVKELPDGKVASLTKKGYGFAVYFFINFHKAIKVNN